MAVGLNMVFFPIVGIFAALFTLFSFKLRRIGTECSSYWEAAGKLRYLEQLVDSQEYSEYQARDEEDLHHMRENITYLHEDMKRHW